MKKRVIVFGHHPSVTGGVGNFLRIFTEVQPSDVELEIFVNGRRENENSNLLKIVRLAGDYLRFAFLLISARPSLVHFNPTMDRTSFPREALFMLMARLFGVRYLIFFRGWEWEAFSVLFTKTDLISWLCKSSIKDATAILVLADIFRVKLVEKLPSAKATIVSTMFDGRLIDRTRDKNFDNLVMLFMSRFIPAKRGDQVIKAFADILAKYPRSRLIMAGDGPEMRHWRALASDLVLDPERVSFTGHIGSHKKREALDAANVFVLPTEHAEGLPNALLEAMGAGMIPLTTEAGGTFEVMKDGRYGVCLSSSEASEIVRAVNQIMLDPSNTALWSTEIKDYAWEHFEANVVRSRLHEIYRDILGSPN